MSEHWLETGTDDTGTGLEIAVIGMAGRFPGAANLHEFWENLKNGLETITFFSDDELTALGADPEMLQDTHYIKAGSILDQVEYFDAVFFGYAPADAELMAPQTRIFHEITWHALEDAGYVPYTYNGTIGIYAGSSPSAHWEAISFLSGKHTSAGEFGAGLLADKDHLSTRISYNFNLRGPSFTLSTACSTSLVAIHLACQGLLSGECKMAAAGGVTIMTPRGCGYLYLEEGSVLSRDGHCRSFDARSTGTILGEGAGVVILKCLEDAREDRDHIYALIKGSAINNDGSSKVGYTAPGAKGQTAVIRAALHAAGVEPESISYLEAHGTGTEMGDPIEINALTQAFNTGKKHFCRIGSVKTNVGHLVYAAGVTGLIKAVLALYFKLIPPTLFFESPNPGMSFENSPFQVNRRLTPWKRDTYPLRAGVSSFGLGGTNAHVILEEAPPASQQALAINDGKSKSSYATGNETKTDREYQLIVLSAKTQSALDRLTENVAEHFRHNPGINLADAAFTLQTGRMVFPYRRMAVCQEVDEAVAVLSDYSQKMSGSQVIQENRPVIFMFSGLGSQYVNMGKGLYEHEEMFRRQIDTCSEILEPLLDRDVREILYPKENPEEAEQQMDKMIFSGPIKFIYEYSLAKLLINWGLQPEAMIGHSFGEYVAACLSGVFSLEDALKLVVLRGQLLEKAPEGAMLSVPLPEEELTSLLELQENKDLSIASVNSPDLCVVSGTTAAVDRFEQDLREKGCEPIRLNVNRAGHSTLMGPIIAEFKEHLDQVTGHKPKIPYISGLTGTWISAEQAGDPGYWARHLQETIKFSQGLQELLSFKKSGSFFVEISPGRGLTLYLSQQPARNPGHLGINMVRHKNEKISDVVYTLNRLGEMWLYGAQVDWTGLHTHQQRYRVSMPLYPFQPQHYWIDGDISQIIKAGTPGQLLNKKRPDMADWFYTPSWKRSVITVIPASRPVKLLFFLGSGNFASELLNELIRYEKEKENNIVVVKAGSEFTRQGDNVFIINPGRKEDYQALVKELPASAGAGIPLRVVHAWNLTGAELDNRHLRRKDPLEHQHVERFLDSGFYSLLYLVQALDRQNSRDFLGKIEITVLTDGMQEVLTDRVLYPEKAVVLGPVQVIPREFPHIKCRCIDLDPADTGNTNEKEKEHRQFLIDSLLRELNTGITDPLIAYRGIHRLVRTFEPVPLNQRGSEAPRLRKRGVYLITGGLGGIGLVMARHLAETRQARLILVGRSFFPEPGDWQTWINTHDRQDSISQKIRTLYELESSGAQVLVFSMDVTDAAAMQALVKQVIETFVTINGVIHAAGLPAGGLIQLKTRDMADRILAPKVKGTLVLDRVLAGIQLDFIMLCSSVSSVVPFMGQVDYFAANAFLDAFAFYKTSLDRTYTVSINWDSWQEVGGAVETAKQLVSKNPYLAEAGYEDFLKQAILPAEGVEAFMRILGENLPQVVVSAIDLPARFVESENLQARMADLGKQEQTPGTAYPRPCISSPYVAPFSPAQEKLAAIWQGILGIDRVGIDDDFFELGGDSLKATVVISKARKEFNADISLKELFSTPKIRDLAKPLETTENSRDANASYTDTDILPVEKREYYPLTPMQKRLYILEQMEGIGTAYNQPYAWIIQANPGPGNEPRIDLQQMEQVFQFLIHRHESLRTSYHMVDDEPTQKIHDHIDFNIEYVDLTGREEAGSHDSSSLSSIMKQFVRPFDLAVAPLLRVGLVKLPGETGGNYLMFLDIHHIAADGTSYIILFKDFITLYEENSGNLAGLRVGYKDFSIYVNTKSWQAVITKQEEFWIQEFRDEIPQLDLYTDYPRPALQNFTGDRVMFQLDTGQVQALNELALSEGATLFMVLLALYTVLLSRLSGQEDIVVGTPVAARRDPDLEPLMGMFVNTLALRNRPRGEMSFDVFLREVRKKTLDAFENQEYPFEELVETVRVHRDFSRNPLFDVMMALDNYQMDFMDITGQASTPDNKKNKTIWQPGENLYRNKTARFDITFDIFTRGETLVFTVDYCTRLFKKETIQRWTGYFKTLVSSVLGDRQKKLALLDILPPEEKEKLLKDFNGNGKETHFPGPRTIQQLFAETARRFPDHIAVIGSDYEKGVQSSTAEPGKHHINLTYNQLHQQTDLLAVILKERGVRADTIVSIMLELTLEMVTGILAILKSGGAYLPIDPDYPEERIRFMLKDSKASLLLTTRPLVEKNHNLCRLKVKNDYEFIYIDSFEFHSPHLLNFSTSHSSNLAYVIYTSGSTGRPKAVLVEHGNAVNTLLYRKDEYRMDSTVRALQLFSYTFDGFITSFFTPIISGARVVLLTRQKIKEIETIKKAIVRLRVTHFISVPALFRAVAGEMIETDFKSLTVVTLAGDILSPELVEIILQKTRNLELSHEYGVTEAAVMNTIFRHQEKSEKIVIGKPIANINICILNRHDQLQALGIPGEICIIGAGLARGYMNNPELTSNRFKKLNKKLLQGVQGDGFLEKSPPGRRRQYKTNDLGRWLPGGNIEFLGRIDRQVKIRGYRIEPGEIENRLLTHKHIKQALVNVLPDNTGDRYLCAYIVADTRLEAQELRKYLSVDLPGYMIPRVIMPLENIPLTSNGKIDFRKLPLPGVERERGQQYIEPRNAIERKLVDIWSEVLSIEKNRIGMDAGFFEMGGHSLKAAILVSNIHKALHVRVPLIEVFRRQTVSGLSAYIQEASESIYTGIVPVEKREYYPLSSAQKRLYFLQQMEPGSTAYNIPLVLSLGTDLEADRLEGSLKKLIARHESLRTSIIRVNDVPVQRFFRPDQVQFEIPFHSEGAIKDSIRPFDLSLAPLIRSAVIKNADGNHTWLVDLHHIVSDGTSHMNLVSDFMAFYNHNETGLQPLKLQYKEFSQWQNHLFSNGEITHQEEYWFQLYWDAREIPRLELPADYKRPGIFTFTGDQLGFRMEAEQSRAFKALGTRNGATLYMNILAALNTLFYKYTRQTDIIIGTGIAGRPHADLQGIIGMFVNTLAIRNHPQGEKTYEDFLKDVTFRGVQAFENQDVQFEELVDRLDLERDASRNPLFDVMMVVQNFKPFTPQPAGPSMENPGQIQVRSLPFTSKFDMTFFVYEEAGTGEILIDIEYYTALFKKDTISRMAQHFQELVRRVLVNPAMRLDDIDIVPAEEKHRILVQFNDTYSDYPIDKTIGELFEQQVEKTPDNVAVIGSGTGFNTSDPGKYLLHITYRQLNETCNQLAGYLVHETGVVPGEPVGLLLNREVGMITAILGILKAGAGYVPLSPSFPEERMKTMIADASIRTLIGQKCFIKRLNRLQWEVKGLETFLCMDSQDVQLEPEEEQSRLMSRKLWEYVGETSGDDITAGGWNSSYTGRPFPKPEMDEYGNNILVKLEPLLHKQMRVLEIGAASGISMYRLAPRVALYYGTDLSEATIEKNKTLVQKQGFQNIKLSRLAAHEIHHLDEHNFDLVIMNSVVQCFNGHNYLRNVFRKIIALMKNTSKGYIFIGDIMDQDQKNDLIADLVAYKAAHLDSNNNTKTDWSEELFISRAFLEDLMFQFPALVNIEFSRKIYTIENELTRFRYDALITVDKTGKHTPLIKKRHKYQHDLKSLRKYSTTKTFVNVIQRSDSMAYVIYTSGSTGIPKGTLTAHYNVTRVVKNTNYITIHPQDRILQLSDYAFDGSMFDIFGALLNGASLVMIKRRDLLEIDALCHLLIKEKISLFFVTTALFNTLVDVGLDSLSNVRKILFGGERVSVSHTAKALRCLGKNRIIHVYGPTETTVYATFFPVNHIDDCQLTIPIGSPISNTSVYILDSFLNLSAIGVCGEIFIAGPGLAPGYLNNPDASSQNFCLRRPGGSFYKNRPLDPRKNFLLRWLGSRSADHDWQKIYRSGDLGRWLEDGNIEFLGRIDEQVKIRGFRIELGEIESCLLKYSLINEAVVLDREDKDGERFLIAYFVCGMKVDITGLREFLGLTLPGYMIPSFFVQVDKIPLNSTGKVNKKALPLPGFNSREDHTPARDDLEKNLVKIWMEVLNTPTSMGIDDNFFELGGHSLKATTLTAKIHKELGTKVPLSEIFKSPTIRKLSGFLKKAGKVKDRYVSIQPTEKKDYYALSSAQKRLYILQQLDKNNTGYNSSAVVFLEGELDKKKFESIFTGLILRHQSLRTRFQLVDEEPVQTIQEKKDICNEFVFQDFIEMNHSPADLIDTFIGPFDLSRAPLMRVGLIKWGKNRHVLIVDMHHIITDGTSQGILIKEFTRFYAGKELPPLKLRYQDYAQWQNSQKRKNALKIQEEYWLKQFNGEIPVLNLPADFPRPPVRSSSGETLTFEIGKQDTRALNALALKNETTLYMLLLSIFNILLSRLGNQEDIIVGTPTAGRSHAGLGNIIGMFVNTLALRNFPIGEKTVNEFLDDVTQQTLEAFENQEYQFEDLVEKVEIQRDTARNPLFDTMFALQNVDIPVLDIHGLKVSPYNHESHSARFDLSLQVYETEQGLLCKMEYSSALFRKQTIQGFTRYFKCISAAVLKNSEMKLSQLEILPEDEKQKILVEFNETESEFPVNKTLFRIFAEQVRQTPDNIAVVAPFSPISSTEENTRSRIQIRQIRGQAPCPTCPTLNHITYRELFETSNKLALKLKERGVAPDSIVGIITERSIEMITGIMGILKSGGAYLPIDPDYPQDRIRLILKDSKTNLVLTTRPLAEKVKNLSQLNDDDQYELIFIDSLEFQLTRYPQLLYSSTSQLLALSSSPGLAYVLYTSGSTGVPKGVMVEQRSVINTLATLQREYPLLSSDAYLFKTSYLFDVSVTELFGWYWQGGRLIIMKSGDHRDPAKILNEIKQHYITHINFVPSMFAVFLEFFEQQEYSVLERIKHIFLAGEALPADLVDRFRRLGTGIPLENLYGPTEGTIYASRYSLSPWRSSASVPIGKPLANVKLYILNHYFQPQPIGTAGELYISGTGLARGYLNKPELTLKKFIKTVSVNNKKLLQGVQGDGFLEKSPPGCRRQYKTSDLARWRSDGNMEFLGRIDLQVKIRGYRIELGEIESRLRVYPGIQEAVVITRQDKEGDRHLCAYIVLQSSASLGLPEIKKYLLRTLPVYMVPAYFSFLEYLPLTSSGKVNRAALPEPEVINNKGNTAPRNEVERKLAGIWQTLLSLPSLPGIESNFFEIGGHSLKATIMAARIQKEFKVEIPLGEIFKTPRIKGLALMVRASVPVQFIDIEAIEKKEYYELSYNQKRLWIIYCMNPESTSYHLPGLVHFNQAVNIEALKKALTRIFARHESFRTGFKEIRSQAVQFIPEHVSIPVEIFDISSLPAEEKQPEALEIIRRISTQPFDLAIPPLFRSALIKQDVDAFIFVYNMHHIISDGWSMELVKEEFTRCYEAFTTGRAAYTQPLQFQYKDFASWHNRQIRDPEQKEKARYRCKELLVSGIPKLNLSYFYNNSNFAPHENRYARNRAGAAYRCVVNREIKLKLHALARESHTTLFTVLFSMYNLLLAYLSGQNEIAITIVNAGREHPSLHMIVGYFINPLIVKTRVDLEKDFKDLLSGINHNVLEAYHHQYYPLELAADELGIEYPEISTAFNLLNMQDISTGMKLESLESYHIQERQEVKFPLALVLTEYKNGIEICWEYQKSLFKPETIEEIAGKYIQLADEITGDE